MARKRPDFTKTVSKLLHFLATDIVDFQHIDPRRIVVVAGEARRASRATVRPLFFAGGKRIDATGRRKPLVRINGLQARYIITLRPLFFRRSTPRQRVSTIVHELFHISLAFDGTLESTRRHHVAGRSFARTFRPLERRCWRRLPASLLKRFSYNGEVWVQQWLEQPQTTDGAEVNRRRYTEKQLFLGVMRMKPPRPPRALE